MAADSTTHHSLARCISRLKLDERASTRFAYSGGVTKLLEVVVRCCECSGTWGRARYRMLRLSS
ncbi:hypothetical protein BCR35DRAFT_181531 [Leucosporidium creatinivorum]|uniref:Uncharacterized protein n=1 Tax=Leucosporidium creatinivorum TaxID=106004 RepID=A0A1Y2E5D3_9BASI|nr:hypothetical protein BCR35DRAFT_181531 [Leucosporidium creatinivorum]